MTGEREEAGEQEVEELSLEEGTEEVQGEDYLGQEEKIQQRNP